MIQGLFTKRTTQAWLTWSADDWQLYTDMDGVAAVAEALNRTFEESVNSGKSRSEVEIAMLRVMAKYDEFGADDSEPFDRLGELLDEVFLD